MGVAGHLRIALDEYDVRIRTFVPWYEDMVAFAASALRFLRDPQPAVVDLGIGTGALSAACLERRPDARITGLDSDAGMLDVARARLARAPRVELIEADFVTSALPRCDAFVACISLHHIRSEVEKRAFYGHCFDALPSSGLLITADCFPARQPAVAEDHRDAWLAHLASHYSRAEAEKHLASWANEDFYFPLHDELDWLESAGFAPEVLWRRDGFAVIVAFKGPVAASSETTRLP